MERVDAELALGRVAEVVVELERFLIAVAPLQERLRGQMMLARDPGLGRAGRRRPPPDRAACTLLRDELGLTSSA